MEILNVVICFVVKPTQYLNVKLLRREIKVLERHLVHLEFGIVYLNMWQMLLPVVLLPADSYEVKLSTMETVTLQASELELPTVSGLFVYPVKSCAGISMDEVKLTPKALVRPKLLPNVDIDEVQSVVLTAEGMPELEVPVLKAPEGQVRVVSVWKDKVEGVDQGDAAAKWLDTFLKEENKSFRLVRVRDGFTRHTKPKYAPGHATNFADAFPFLLALEESLTDFNEKLEDAVPMNRFRPNIVLRGSPPFTDEHWNCITIGGIQFRNVRPCARCGMPSVDQATGIVHPKREPSRAIVRERNGELLGFTDGKKVEGYFGSNMVVEFNEGDSKPPKLTIGASVKVLTLKKEIVA
ncbi:hypothetical protein BBO99_00000795 [Phytophthora kernoviae]|uniref:MOSC domain-containing protein n=3 Tax=Phytophthora kernoviae TaxID=325452 RepID=A0A421H204_9STRA|nr:hypothetical protein G195_005802 [Phytophthora kernoviae 00238/432]KAG2526064.1 hypothetical protein JM18_004578 [Phytophthora kernoviae]RLN85143.1 hypothetical protein BBO99_00000795 [Phytophthora kernoviae]